MKYALVNGEREEAQPKVPGICPYCDSPVIAKCGRVRKPYWAHKNKQMCDSWKEPETPWHRAWNSQITVIAPTDDSRSAATTVASLSHDSFRVAMYRKEDNRNLTATFQDGKRVD